MENSIIEISKQYKQFIHEKNYESARIKLIELISLIKSPAKKQKLKSQLRNIEKILINRLKTEIGNKLDAGDFANAEKILKKSLEFNINTEEYDTILNQIAAKEKEHHMPSEKQKYFKESNTNYDVNRVSPNDMYKNYDQGELKKNYNTNKKLHKKLFVMFVIIVAGFYFYPFIFKTSEEKLNRFDFEKKQTNPVPVNNELKGVFEIIPSKGTVKIDDKKIDKSKNYMSGKQVVSTSDNSAILKVKDSNVFIYPKSQIQVEDYKRKQGKLITNLNIKKGKVFFKVNKLNKNNVFRVKTPTMVAGVRGTKFLIDVTAEKEKIFCTEGIVNVFSNKTNESVNISKGQSADLSKDTIKIDISEVPEKIKKELKRVEKQMTRLIKEKDINKNNSYLESSLEEKYKTDNGNYKRSANDSKDKENYEYNRQKTKFEKSEFKDPFSENKSLEQIKQETFNKNKDSGLNSIKSYNNRYDSKDKKDLESYIESKYKKKYGKNYKKRLDKDYKKLKTSKSIDQAKRKANRFHKDLYNKVKQNYRDEEIEAVKNKTKDN